MAKQTAADTKPRLPERATTFVREVKNEMDKVAWPSKDELKSSTTIVMLLLAILAAIIGMYDFVFQFVVLMFLKLG